MKTLKIMSMLILICFVYVTPKTDCYWNTYSTQNTNQTINITVGQFNYITSPCMLVGLTINEEFYNTYMVKNAFGVYEWKKDEHNNIINRTEIESLTYEGLFIKNDLCYEVINDSYDFISHGLPSQTNTLSWAFRPVRLEYVSGFSYNTNRVVKTSDNQYFMARFYTSVNPLLSRTGWDKIEPVTSSNFYYYENSYAPNFSNPKTETIIRAYLWDAYTTYLVGDRVLYNGQEYVAVSENNGKMPSKFTWAWNLTTVN